MGLAPNHVPENAANSTAREVPVPIFSQAHREADHWCRASSCLFLGLPPTGLCGRKRYRNSQAQRRLSVRGQFTAVVRSGRVCLLVVLFLAISATARAQSSAIVRVEEDWELVVAAPDSYTDAPQVTCVISPVGNVKSLHAALDLNYHSLPVFISGGLQLQVWEGEIPVTYKNYPNPSLLAQAGETISWTQRMDVADGQLKFEIINGSSATWGPFGGQGYLKANVPTSLVDLSGYNPYVSIENSGVGYAGNRVQSLVLKAVRCYTASGEVYAFPVAWTVYPRN
jgi:hypothetical protein